MINNISANNLKKIFSVILTATLLVSGFFVANYALAAHTHTPAISPTLTKGSTPTVYTITITNNGLDAVDWVKITKPTEYGNVTCGDAPTEWGLEELNNNYCTYYTNNPITAGNAKSFTFTLTTPGSSGTYTWTTRTRDINMVYNTKSPTSDIDTVPPTVTNIAVDTATVKDSDLTQLVTVTYFENMDQTVTPTIAFSNGTWTPGAGVWSDATHYAQTFTLTDSAQEFTGVDITVTGAKDVAGNIMVEDAIHGTDKFNIDTKNPTATVTRSVNPIYEGALTQTVIVTYNEAMDPAHNPVITLTGTHWGMQDGGAWSTVTFTNDTYTTTFTHDVTQESVPAAVATVASASGATDLNGNTDVGGVSSAFMVDTQKATVTGVTPTALAEANVGSVPVIITFNENMDQASVVTVQVAGITGTPAVTGAWTSATQWTGAFILVDDDEEVATAYYAISGAKDVAGNTIVAIAARGGNNALNVDTLKPTVGIVVADTALIAGETSLLTFNFSEAPTGFTVEDITAPHGTLSAFTVTGDPLVYTATFTPTAGITEAVNVITVGTVWTDAAGNAPAGPTNSANYAIDTIPPAAATVSIAAGAVVTKNVTPTLTLTPGATAPDFMRFSCDGTTWGNRVAWETTYSSFNLTTGAGCSANDGKKTVYVSVEDTSGNIQTTVNSDTIIYDDLNNTLTVGPGGSYDFTTIQAAINAATASDTISVAAGTYTEDLVIDGKNLTLSGAGSGSDSALNTIIQGVADYKNSLEVKNVSSLTVSGFRFSGKDNGGTMYGISAYDDPIVVNIHDNAFVFIKQNGVQLGNSQTGSVIQNNQFIRETRGTVTRGGAGPSLWNCTGGLVKGNNMTSVTGVGIFLYGCTNVTVQDNQVSALDKTSPSDEGIHVQSSNTITIRGNTVSNFTHGPVSGYDHGKKGAGIWISGGCNAITIEDNDLIDNSVGVYVATTAILPSPTGVKVNQNKIERNVHYGVLNIKYPASGSWNEWDYQLFGAADAVVDATANWWGSPAQKTTIASKVSGLVNFNPWYLSNSLSPLSSNPLSSTDTTGPTVVLTNNIDGRTTVKNSDTVIITATFSDVNGLDSGVTPKITISNVGVTDQSMTAGVNVNTWTYSWDVPGGDFPTANVTILAKDIVGNNNQAATGVTVYTIDNIPPTLNITAPLTTTKNNASAIITFANNSDLTPLVAECSIDNSVWVACTTGVTTLGGITGFDTLPEAAFTLYLRDADLAGNVGTDSEAGIVKDTVAPTVGIVVADDALKAGDTSLVTFTFSEAPTGFDATDVTVGNGAIGVVSATGNPLVFEATLIPTTIESATNKITVGTSWTDVTGNAPTATTDSNNYAIDTVVPTAAITYSKDAGATYNATEIVKDADTLRIKATFSEPMADAPIVKLAVDNAVPVATDMTKVSATEYYYDLNVPGGDIALAIVSLSIGTDIAGNVITPAPTSGTTFTIDNSAPALNITAPLSGNKVKEDVVINFTDNDIHNAECSVDNTNWTACTTGVTTLGNISEFAGLGEAAFTLYIKDADLAGNVGTDSEIDIVKDTVAPTVVLSDDHTDSIVRDADSVVITATFTEANNLSGTPKISIGGLVTDVDMSGADLVWTYSWDVPAGNDGVVSVSISASDTAGNPNVPATGKTSYTIDNTKPVIVNPTPNNGDVTSDTTPDISVQFTEVGSGINTATTVITVDGINVTAFASIDDSDVTYTPVTPLSVGIHNAVVDVSDNVGNAATQLSWAFAVVNDDTTMTVTTNKPSVLADGASQVKITATILDPSGNPVTSGNVTFSTTIGSLTETSVELDGEGKAITYAYSTETGQTTITVTFTTENGSIKTSSKTVEFTETPKSISVITDDESVPANNSDMATITAIILNVSTPISGGTVTFSTTRGTLSSASAVSNDSGQATVTITSTSAGSARVTAYYSTGSEIISQYVDITFTAVDTTPPTATQWPIDGATDVALNAHPYIQFSRLMDESTLVAGNIEIRLYDSETTMINSAITISTGGGATRVTFAPNSNLTPGTKYFFYIGAGVKDLVGKSLNPTWTTTNKLNHEFTTRALSTSWNIPLATGWNLISFPLIPTNTAIGTVLSGISNVTIVKYYAPATETWLSYVPGVGGALGTMEDGKGYWVNMTAPATLTINGTESPAGGSLPSSYQVVGNKWNLMGFKSMAQMLASKYLGISGTNDIMQKGDNTITHSATEDRNMESGFGYWLYHEGNNYTIIPLN
jgi:parallel beta-helix repeat protein